MIEIKVFEIQREGAIGFIANVIYDDNVILVSDWHKTEASAKRQADGMLNQSLYRCRHEFVDDDGETVIDNEWGGADYITTETCKVCKLIKYYVRDRSVYED